MPDLLVLADVEGVVGLPSGQSDRLPGLITAASRICEQYAGCVLAQESFVERHRPGETRSVYLKNRPVISVESVQLGSSMTVVAPSEYDVDLDRGVILLRVALSFVRRYPDRPWGDDPAEGTVHVTYTAGYHEVPADVKHAALLVLRAMVESETIELGLRRRKLHDSEYVRQAPGPHDQLPSAARAILDRYRRTRLA